MSIDGIYNEFVNAHAGYDLDYVAQKKHEVFNYVLDDVGIDKSKAADILNKVVALCCEYERQGFTYGFVEGMQLQKEVADLSKPEQ